MQWLPWCIHQQVGKYYTADLLPQWISELTSGVAMLFCSSISVLRLYHVLVFLRSYLGCFASLPSSYYLDWLAENHRAVWCSLCPTVCITRHCLHQLCIICCYDFRNIVLLVCSRYITSSGGQITIAYIVGDCSFAMVVECIWDSFVYTFVCVCISRLLLFSNLVSSLSYLH